MILIGNKTLVKSDRELLFHVGQVWLSPRGYFYKVMDVNCCGQAVLRGGMNGNGRKVLRNKNAVIRWSLHSDS